MKTRTTLGTPTVGMRGPSGSGKELVTEALDNLAEVQDDDGCRASTSSLVKKERKAKRPTLSKDRLLHGPQGSPCHLQIPAGLLPNKGKLRESPDRAQEPEKLVPALGWNCFLDSATCPLPTSPSPAGSIMASGKTEILHPQ